MALPVGLRTTAKYHGLLGIQKYSTLSQTTSLLVIKKPEDCYVIHPFQFIASCKVEDIGEEILLGFYLDEFNEFQCFPLNKLPSNKYFYFSGFGGDEDRFVVDYASYQKICSLTGEPCWSLAQYISDREDAPYCAPLNTLFLRDGKLLPYGTDSI